MSERLVPNGFCWCGCGTLTSNGSFFARGHDKIAEAALIAAEYGGTVPRLLAAHGYGPDRSVTEAATTKGDWIRCSLPGCHYVGAETSVRKHETMPHRAQHLALERAISVFGGRWDPQQAIITLASAGHTVDEKRARQLLRDTAEAGLLVKIQDRPVQYRAVKK